LKSVLILAAAVLVVLAGTACSLHYVQSTDGQVLDLEILRAVPVNQPPERSD